MNKYILKILQLLVFIVLVGQYGNGMPFAEASDSTFVNNQQGIITIRHIDKEIINDYRNKKEYDYREMEAESPGFLQRIFSMIKDFFYKIFKIKINLWSYRFPLLALLIVSVVLILLKSNMKYLFKSNSKINDSVMINYDVNPSGIDWSKQIKNAEKNNEYRIAIRFYFLWLLKQLNKNGFIVWKLEKTNFDYAREINNDDIKYNFLKLNKLYEAVWYGNFPVIKDDYDKIGNDFINFLEKINNEK